MVAGLYTSRLINRTWGGGRGVGSMSELEDEGGRLIQPSVQRLWVQAGTSNIEQDGSIESRPLREVLASRVTSGRYLVYTM